MNTRITYSQSLESVIGHEWQGQCLHVLCHEGEGHFLYEGRPVNFATGDILVITYPEKVTYFMRSEGLRLELIAASLDFIRSFMPANHYGIGGGISLYQDPVIHAKEDDMRHFEDDLHKLRDRSSEPGHLFHYQLLGSLLQTMVYDLFDFHAREHPSSETSDRTGTIIQSLITLLESGLTRTHREVAFYADRLNVSPRYLSETVRRVTGQTVTDLITQYSIPLIIEALKDPQLSVTQIADSFDFNNLNYFSRYVKKHLGTTPSQYRASLQPSKVWK